MEGREEEEELREVRGGERLSGPDEQRRGYPDGFRRISGVLERLENWDKTLSL